MKPWLYKIFCLLFVAFLGAGIYTYVTLAAGGPPPSNPDPDPGIAAEVVLGQEDFVSSVSDIPVSGSHMYGPEGVFVGGGKTYVADLSNNRVLIWNTTTPINGQAADVVLGQVDFGSYQGNRGGVAGADTLYSPSSVFADSTNIYVADLDNNRVLIWNTTTPINGQAADVVLGQVDFSSIESNRGGVANSSALSGVSGVFSDGNSIYVADSSNNRVLIWNTTTPINGQAADVVLGQVDFDSVEINRGLSPNSSALHNPTNVSVDSSHIYVVDQGNSRVLIWNTTAPTNGQAADVVLGQVDFDSYSQNQGGGMFLGNSSTLRNPTSVLSDNSHIYVADQGNDRVLIWNTTSPTNGQGADVVLGQAGFEYDGGANRGGAINSSTLFSPTGVFSDGTHIYVADQGNSRVVMWNTVTPTNGQGADGVLGQEDFTSGSSARPSAATLYNPSGVFAHSSKVYVADTDNNRILIYNTSTPSIGQIPDVVLGQTGFSSRGYADGETSLYGPHAVTRDDNNIYVADTYNHRVLIWNTTEPISGQAPDVVLGQADFDSSFNNRGGWCGCRYTI